MPLRIKISARTAREIATAAQWWSENKPAAPGAVTKDIGESLKLPAEQPGIESKYGGTRTPDVRRLFLGQIGYFVYCREFAGSLEALALWHASREKQPSL